MKISTKKIVKEVLILELTKQEVADLNILLTSGIERLSLQDSSSEKAVISVIESGHSISELIAGEVFK